MNSISEIAKAMMETLRKTTAEAAVWIKRTSRLVARQAVKIYRKSMVHLDQLWKRVTRKPVPADSNTAEQLSRTTSRIALNKLPKSKPIRRRSRERVYRLKGFTTVAKINRKRQSEMQQRLLRRLLFFVIIILTFILLFNLYNPIRDLTEWYRILGIQGLSDLIVGQETTIVKTTTETISQTIADTTLAP